MQVGDDLEQGGHLQVRLHRRHGFHDGDRLGDRLCDRLCLRARLGGGPELGRRLARRLTGGLGRGIGGGVKASGQLNLEHGPERQRHLGQRVHAHLVDSLHVAEVLDQTYRIFKCGDAPEGRRPVLGGKEDDVLHGKAFRFMQQVVRPGPVPCVFGRPHPGP